MLGYFSNPDMQPRFANKRCRAFTVVDVVVVVVALLLVIAVLLLPTLARIKAAQQPFMCASNLHQVVLTVRVWQQDNNINLYPMQVSVTNGGAMELIATDNVAGFFQVMSNELSTTKILRCPVDRQVIEPTNGFGPGFCNQNISYFVGLDANESYPKRFLFGEDNFEINGSPIQSGVLLTSTNDSISWAPGRHDAVAHGPYLGFPVRHHYWGNLGFADGSVREFSSSGLQDILQQTGLATNRLAIP